MLFLYFFNFISYISKIYASFKMLTAFYLENFNILELHPTPPSAKVQTMTRLMDLFEESLDIPDNKPENPPPG